MTNSKTHGKFTADMLRDASRPHLTNMLFDEELLNNVIVNVRTLVREHISISNESISTVQGSGKKAAFSAIQQAALSYLQYHLNSETAYTCPDGHVIPLGCDVSADALMSLLADHVFTPKNRDYGDAFAEFGVVGIIIRLNDKARRISSLAPMPERQLQVTSSGAILSTAGVGGSMNPKALSVKSENIVDTVVDIANYAGMALMLLVAADRPQVSPALNP